jgi:hypothetical protein
LNSILVTTGIFSGRTYRVKYRAYNIHGWSSYSPEGTVLAATLPGAPASPTLTITGTDVQISWADPADIGGSGITV